MVSDLDIFRTAKLLIDQHGGHEATQLAWARASALRSGGDIAGEETWCHILDAIQELRRTKRGPGEGVH